MIFENAEGDKMPAGKVLHEWQRKLDEELAATNTIQWQIAQKLFPEKESPEDGFEAYLSSGLSDKFRKLLEESPELKKRIVAGENVTDEIIEKISN